jgi:hypothetical protein
MQFWERNNTEEEPEVFKKCFLYVKAAGFEGFGTNSILLYSWYCT